MVCAESIPCKVLSNKMYNVLKKKRCEKSYFCEKRKYVCTQVSNNTPSCYVCYVCRTVTLPDLWYTISVEIHILSLKTSVFFLLRK